MKLKDIAPIVFLSEAKEFKEKDPGFMNFYIEEIKGEEDITSTEDLADKDYIEVGMFTDKNAGTDKLSKNDYYKIKVESLYDYMAVMVPRFESGDYIDFTGSVNIRDVVVGYLENVCNLKHYRKWEDFQNLFSIAMDGDEK